MAAAAMNLLSLDANTKGQLACSLAVLLLHDEKSDVTAEKIGQVVKAAGVEVAAYWPMLLAKNLEGRPVQSFLSAGPSAAAAAPAAEAPKAAKEDKKPAKKEEKKEEPVEEEMDMDMGSLFG